MGRQPWGGNHGVATMGWQPEALLEAIICEINKRAKSIMREVVKCTCQVAECASLSMALYDGESHLQKHMHTGSQIPVRRVFECFV